MFKNEIEAMLLDEILTEKQIPHLIQIISRLCL